MKNLKFKQKNVLVILDDDQGLARFFVTSSMDCT